MTDKEALDILLTISPVTSGTDTVGFNYALIRPASDRVDMKA
jgi:hypothetical protein